MTASETKVDLEVRTESLAKLFVKTQRYLRQARGWSAEEIYAARDALHAAINMGGEDLDSAELFYRAMDREMQEHEMNLTIGG